MGLYSTLCQAYGAISLCFGVCVWGVWGVGRGVFVRGVGVGVGLCEVWGCGRWVGVCVLGVCGCGCGCVFFLFDSFFLPKLMNFEISYIGNQIFWCKFQILMGNHLYKNWFQMSPYMS